MSLLVQIVAFNFLTGGFLYVYIVSSRLICHFYIFVSVRVAVKRGYVPFYVQQGATVACCFYPKESP